MGNNSFIVTGGLGFIGSNLVNYLYDKFTHHDIIILDKLTYAASLRNIRPDVASSGRVHPITCDLASTYLHGNELHPGFSTDHDTNEPPVRSVGRAVNYKRIFDRGIDTVFHLAAESHVDNSISGPGIFVDANITGTLNLLEQCRKHDIGRFVYVSTDEVYGSLNPEDDPFEETLSMAPNNTYSASKASAEMLVRAYNKTHSMDTVVTRCCNNYGPRQHPEKLVPKTITNILNGKKVPVYGQGENVREWIHVMDHCAAIVATALHGKSGEIYNIGSGVEVSNIKLVNQIISLLGKHPENIIEFVDDRKGHDLRYSINYDKIQKEIGWSPVYDNLHTFFNLGLRDTIDWYATEHDHEPNTY